MPVRSPLPKRHPSTRSRPGHQRELGRGDPAPAIVVRVHRHDHAVAAREVPAHPLDLVRVDVGRGELDGRRQVDDGLPLRRRQPDVGDRIADFHGEIELRAREAFRRILEEPLGAGALRDEVADELGPGDGDPLDAVAIEAEHQPALRGRRRVVQMDDGAPGAFQRLERARDLRLARLRQHLDRHVIGNQSLDDQLAREVVVGLRRRRKPDLDLLVAHLHQEPEHPQLAVGIHRLDQRLIAIAQIHAAPDRGCIDRARGPLPLGQRHGRHGAVLARWVGLHGGSSFRRWTDHRIVRRWTTRTRQGGGNLSARGAQQKQQRAARKGGQRGERRTADDWEAAHCKAL